MKTLKDKIIEDFVDIEDLKQAIKDLKKEIEITAISNGIIFPSGPIAIDKKIDKIMGVWEQ